MLKKYLIAAFIILCAAYIVHTRTMTLAEEQPFLDEQSEGTFLDKVKNFFTTSSKNDSDISTAAGAESVVTGARPRKGSAIRGASAPADNEGVDEIGESEYTENEPAQESIEPVQEVSEEPYYAQGFPLRSQGASDVAEAMSDKSSDADVGQGSNEEEISEPAQDEEVKEISEEEFDEPVEPVIHEEEENEDA